MTISDDDTAVVTIAANDASASEPGDDGQVTVSISSPSDTDTVVAYAIGGDATSGDDFTPLTGTVTILAGQTSATIDVTVIDDSILEDAENVTVTLEAITSGDSDISLGLGATATVTISDNDTAEVTIAANDASASEPGDDGQFTVSISIPSDTDTVVAYAIGGDANSGDDFTPLTGTVTILAGQTSATIDVAVIDDSILEDNEAVTVTLDSITSGDADVSIGTVDSATITISDDDTAVITIAANDASASEPGDDGQFTVSISSPSDTDTVVAYAIGGDANSGGDFTPLTGTVTILAGQTSATIDVAVIDDSILEDAENVTVTLEAITSGDSNISLRLGATATVTISDNDTAEVTVVASDASASEPGDDGQFTVSISNASDTDTIVAYTIGGDAATSGDYTALSGTVTILAGQTSATIDVAVIDDSILEDNESVTLTLDSITAGDAEISIGAADSATVTIADDDTAEVTVVASDATASEPGDDGQFTVSISSASDTDTVVAYTIGGDAAASDDYTALSGTVTILAGQTSATIDVAVIDDSILEDNESVTLTLDSITAGDADISIGATDSATVTISDDDTAEVTIAANDASASEPGDDGQFTVSISNPSDTDTVVTFTIGGNATSGDDFTPLTGTVTILAGQTSATIDVAVLDDSLLETSETVTVQLASISSGDADVSIGAADSATVVIADDDSTTVNIAATTASASEPNTDGQFTVTLANASSTDTTISYSVGGDAVEGTDFANLSGSVTILAGQTSATIDIAVLDDSILESTESVTVTLDDVTAGDPSISLGTSITATVTITDDDSGEVTVVASDATAAEPTDSGQFTVSISSVSDTDTVIAYTIGGDATSGSDFTPLSGTVTILAGQSSVIVDVDAIDDSILEGTESVTLTLNSITSGDADIAIGAAANATVTISDDDSALVTITANDDAASEPGDNGQFTISISNASDTDTIVTYVISGDASAGDDYTALSGTATILAGQTSTTVDVNVIDDSTLEGDEVVTLMLDAITSGDPDIALGIADTASVTISDDDMAVVTITASDAAASEPGNDGQFTVSISSPSDTDTVIAYAIGGDATSGDDFTALTGTVTILAGQTTATIDIAVADDSILEDAENVTVTLESITSGDSDVTLGLGATATVMISDDDTAEVTIAANDATASEPGDEGQFTVSISSPSDTDTVVAYSISGDATSGDDFTPLTGTVTILAGQTSATIDVAVVDDSVLEDSESVTVTLESVTAGDDEVSIGAADNATVSIADNDTGLVTISATDASAGEPSDTGTFTVSISAPSDTDTVIDYRVSGDATSGVDFVALAGSVTILAGQTSATIDVNVLDDSILEAAESVTVSLDAISSGDSDLTLGAADTATVVIADDDSGTVNIVANDDTANEPGDDGQFTVSLNAPSATDTVIAYSISGDATAGTDYATLSGTVTILAGQTTSTIDVNVIDDSILEDNEFVTVTLESITSGDSSISVGASATASVTIGDDDTATVSVVATDSAASEPSDDGQFTISISAPSDTDTTVSYALSGDATAGDDFTVLSGTATILAGQTSVVVDVSVVDDSILEADEALTLTLTAINSGDSGISIDAVDNATINISDDDTAQVNVFASDPNAAEPTDGGQFTVTLTNPSDSDTIVAYTIGGDAGSGADFTPLSGSVTVLAGQTSAVIDVTTVDDSILEANESLTLTLDAITSGDSDITLGSTTAATVTIADDDTAEVTVVANDSAAAEPGDDGQFTISISNPSDTDTIVNYTVSGDAVSGDDFVTLPGSVTILAGQTTVSVDLAVLDDSVLEASESVTLTLDSVSGDADIVVGASNAATVTIADDDSASVSITANDPAAAEPGDDGQFTVTLDAISDTDTVISYSVSGDATSATDFDALSGTVTVLAGQTTATIDLSIVDDAVLESDETVVVTLDAILSGDADISIGAADSASATIADDDSAEVTVSASDPNASEPSDGGQFTVSIGSPADTDTVVAYTISGTATSGDDFTPLSGTLTILAGNTSATVAVAAIDDSVLENDESVTITLDSITSGDADLTIGSVNSATVTIADDDTALVSIVANDPVAGEPSDGGQFTVSIDNPSDTDLVVFYDVAGDATAGSDYTALTGSVTITAGQTTATINLATLDDSLVELSESVVITLTGTNDADVSVDTSSSQATVTISDDDSSLVSVLANDNTASEPSDDGQFTVSLSELSTTDTLVSYAVSGTATAGDDFVSLVGTVLISAGTSSATIDVDVLDQSLLENDETVIVTLLSTDNSVIDIDNTADTATVTIADDDMATVAVSVSDPTAAEPADNGQFTVTISEASDRDTVVNYVVTGSADAVNDFNAVSGSVVISAGTLSATIDIGAVDDSVLEADETVIVTLVGTDDPDVTVDTGSPQATVTISDDDTAEVTITANDSLASEPGDDGQFTVTLSSPSDTDTTMAYVVTGDATAGTDFVALSGSVTILAGDTSATIDVSVLDDNLLEDNELVVATLTSVTSGDADVSISTTNAATITIADNDTALVSIAATDALAAEPSSDGQFTVCLLYTSDAADE